MERDICRCFIEQVDGLIGQEAVGDIAFTHDDGLFDDVIGDGDAVVLLIVMLDAGEDRDGIVDRRLVHGDRLEAAFERGILFDIFAVFGQGRCADDLNFTAGEGGLENVGGVHRTFRVTGTGDGVDFVDDEDDVARRLDVLDQTLHARFKLTAELGSGNKRRQIEQVDFFVLQLIRNVGGGNLLRQRFRNRGFADTGFTDQTGVILLAAAEDLNQTRDFTVTSDHGIQLSLSCTCGQIDAVRIEEFRLLFLFFFLFFGCFCVVTVVRPVVALHRVTEQTAEHRAEINGRCSALLGIVVAVFFALRHKIGEHRCAVIVFRFRVTAVHHCGELLHIIVHAIEIVIGNAHLLEHIVDGTDAHLSCTAQAKSFIECFVSVHACHENNGDTLFTS